MQSRMQGRFVAIARVFLCACFSAALSSLSLAARNADDLEAAAALAALATELRLEALRVQGQVQAGLNNINLEGNRRYACYLATNPIFAEVDRAQRLMRAQAGGSRDGASSAPVSGMPESPMSQVQTIDTGMSAGASSRAVVPAAPFDALPVGSMASAMKTVPASAGARVISAAPPIATPPPAAIPPEVAMQPENPMPGQISTSALTVAPAPPPQASAIVTAAPPAARASASADPLNGFDLASLSALAREWGPRSPTVVRIQGVLARLAVQGGTPVIDRRLLLELTPDGIWGPITERVFRSFLADSNLRALLIADSEFREIIRTRPLGSPLQVQVGNLLRVDRSNLPIYRDANDAPEQMDVFGPGTILRVTGRRTVGGAQWAEIHIPRRAGEQQDPNSRGWIRLDGGNLRTEVVAGRALPRSAGDLSVAAVEGEIRGLNERRRGASRMSEQDIAQVAEAMDRAAREFRIPLFAVAALCIKESGGRPRIRTTGNSSARGLCQITGSTWEAWRRQLIQRRGIDVGPFQPNVWDPYKNALLTAMSLKDGMDKAASIWRRLEPREPMTDFGRAGWAWIGHFHGRFYPGMDLDAPERNQPNPTPRRFRHVVLLYASSMFQRQQRLDRERANRAPPTAVVPPLPPEAGAPAAATGQPSAGS